MPYGTVNADVIQTSTTGGILGAGNASIMKNRIINGAMVIDQRNAGASVTINNSGGFTYTLDRWNAYVSVNGKFTIQKNAGSVTRPVGFTNYLGVTSSSAYTVGSAELFSINQFIEGYHTADLGWGTANAKTVTLSFQVYSSLTGTFGGSLLNNAQNRSYPFSYTISTANTWTTISVTIAGDTSGTWLTDDSTGIKIFFGLGVGSTYSGTAGAWAGTSYFSATGATSVVGTNGATFYLTGVQLEVGSSATGYEYRLYNQELLACQRYYQALSYTDQTIISTGTADGASGCQAPINLLQTMRTAPTITLPSAAKTTGTQAFLTSGGTYPTTVGSHTTPSISVNQFRINASGYTAAFVQGNATWLYSTGSTTITASAEL
jgi:hypothetical protein